MVISEQPARRRLGVERPRWRTDRTPDFTARRLPWCDDAGGLVINPCFVRQARERRREAFIRTPWPPVRFSSVQTAFGTVFVGVSDQGVFDVAFGLRDEAAYRQRLARWAPEVLNNRAGTLRSVIAEIEAYFAGTLRDFSVPVDLRA